MEKGLMDVLDELNEFEVKEEQFAEREEESISSDDELNAYIIKRSSEMIERGIKVLDILIKSIESATDPDAIDSLTKTMRSISSTMDNLTKINIQNKRIKAKEVSAPKPKTPKLEAKTQNIFIGTREEALTAMLGEGTPKQAKEVEVE